MRLRACWPRRTGAASPALTPLSVAWAESSTAASSSNGVVYSSSVVGSGLAAAKRSNSARRSARLHRAPSALADRVGQDLREPARTLAGRRARPAGRGSRPAPESARRRRGSVGCAPPRPRSARRRPVVRRRADGGGGRGRRRLPAPGLRQRLHRRCSRPGRAAGTVRSRCSGRRGRGAGAVGAPTIASTGQARMHLVQPMQRLLSIAATLRAGTGAAVGIERDRRDAEQARRARCDGAAPPGGQRLIGAPAAAIASAYGRHPAIAAAAALGLGKQAIDRRASAGSDRACGGRSAGLASARFGRIRR